MSLLVAAAIFTIFAVVYGKALYDWIRKRKHLVDLAEPLPGLPSLPIIGNAHLLPTTTHGELLEGAYQRLKNSFSSSLTSPMS